MRSSDALQTPFKRYFRRHSNGLHSPSDALQTAFTPVPHTLWGLRAALTGALALSELPPFWWEPGRPNSQVEVGKRADQQKEEGWPTRSCPPAGLEPATCRLVGGCSIQLSYVGSAQSEYVTRQSSSSQADAGGGRCKALAWLTDQPGGPSPTLIAPNSLSGGGCGRTLAGADAQPRPIKTSPIYNWKLEAAR
jgi:hypothetical protein